MGKLNKVTELIKPTISFAGMTLLSRITGLIRELVFAYFFGAGASLDAFWVAYRIPNFFRRLFAEGALSQAFIPVLSDYRLSHNDQETNLFISQLFTWLTIIVVCLTLFSIVNSSFLVKVFAFGFNPKSKLLTEQLLRLTFPFLVFVTLSAFYSGILNSYHRFLISAFAPVCCNIMLILATILGGFFIKERSEAVYILAIGVSIGGLMQWLVQFPAVKKLNKVPGFVFAYPSEKVKKVFLLMIPAIFGISVNQVNFLVNTFLASFMEIGSLSWLNYADRLASVPLGIVGVAVTSVILPKLSCEVVKQNQDKFIETVNWGLSVLMLIAIPSVLGLILLGKPVIATLFLRGAFNLNDLNKTYQALVGYAIGIPFFMQVKILATGFYAHQNLKFPTLVGFWAVVVNLGLAFILSPLGHVGLTFASSVASIVNVIGLYYGLKRRNWYNLSNFWDTLGRIILAQILIGIFLYYAGRDFSLWLALDTKYRMLRMIVVLFVSLLLYFIGLRMSGFKINELMH